MSDDKNSSMLLDNKTSNGNLPRLRCPKCFDYALAKSMDFVCEDCHSNFRVDVKDLGLSGVVDVDPAKVFTDEMFDVTEEENKVVNVNDAQSEKSKRVFFVLEGESLSFMKEIQKKYKFIDLNTTVEVCFDSMIGMINMLEARKSRYVGFVDNENVRSINLKNGGFFKDAKRRLLRKRKTSKEVNDFIVDISNSLLVDELKQFYNKQSGCEDGNVSAKEDN